MTRRQGAETSCRFCGTTIRAGGDVDPSRTAHEACVVAERNDRPDDGERWRRLRQLWKFAKS